MNLLSFPIVSLCSCNRHRLPVEVTVNLDGYYGTVSFRWLQNIVENGSIFVIVASRELENRRVKVGDIQLWASERDSE